MPITTDRDKVRLEIGDTDTANALFTDAEIDVYLERNPNDILRTAADLCDVLATRFAQAYDVSADNQSLKRSQMSQAYSARAKALRDRANGAVEVIRVKRRDSARVPVDGYPYDELDVYNDDLSRNGRVIRGPQW